MSEYGDHECPLLDDDGECAALKYVVQGVHGILEKVKLPDGDDADEHG